MGSAHDDFERLRAHHWPSVGVAAVCSIPAREGLTPVIVRIDASYDAAGAGLATIAVDGTDEWKLDITGAGAAPIPFDDLYPGNSGKAMTVTLAAVALKTGRLNIVYGYK